MSVFAEIQLSGLALDVAAGLSTSGQKETFFTLFLR